MDTIITMLFSGLIGYALAACIASSRKLRDIAETVAEIAASVEDDDGRWQLRDFVGEDCSAYELGPNDVRGRGVPGPACIDFDPPIPRKNNGDELRVWQDADGGWHYVLKKAEK